MSQPTQALNASEHAAREKWIFFSNAQEFFFRLKSRIRWLKAGDSNTKFFHKGVLAHQSWNAITYLRDSLGNNQIKGMNVAYFQNILGSETPDVLPMTVDLIKEIHPFRCDSTLTASLTMLPTDEEINGVFIKMAKSKAPGPDGLSMEFFSDAWDIVGGDAIHAVREFFVSGQLLHSFNTTTIALISKIIGADELSKFRHVAFCLTVYKIIDRLLKKRLKLFVSEVAQMNQVRFLKGRYLYENVLLASELVTGFHKWGPTTRGCLQIDLMKAYDNLN